MDKNRKENIINSLEEEEINYFKILRKFLIEIAGGGKAYQKELERTIKDLQVIDEHFKIVKK